jgi:hypothetical protein
MGTLAFVNHSGLDLSIHVYSFSDTIHPGGKSQTNSRSRDQEIQFQFESFSQDSFAIASLLLHLFWKNSLMISFSWNNNDQTITFSSFYCFINFSTFYLTFQTNKYNILFPKDKKNYLRFSISPKTKFSLITSFSAHYSFSL